MFFEHYFYVAVFINEITKDFYVINDALSNNL